MRQISRVNSDRSPRYGTTAVAIEAPRARSRAATSRDIADDQPKARDPVVDEGLEVGAGAAGKNREFDDELLFATTGKSIGDRRVGDGSGLRWAP